MWHLTLQPTPYDALVAPSLHCQAVLSGAAVVLLVAQRPAMQREPLMGTVATTSHCVLLGRNPRGSRPGPLSHSVCFSTCHAGPSSRRSEK